MVFTARKGRDNTTAVQSTSREDNVRHAKHVRYIVIACIATSPHMYLVLLILSFDFHSLILLHSRSSLVLGPPPLSVFFVLRNKQSMHIAIQRITKQETQE